MNDTLHTPRRVHLVGIGGAGMSGIARILLQRGHLVSGSDLREGRALAELRALGAVIHVGHEAANLGDADLVVTSTAVPPDNPELVAARDQGRTVLRRAQMLAELMAGERAVLIAGTHGKTTTTSMAVVALQAAGRDPSFAIGGSLNESGTNAHAGTDGVFVAEADESDRSFLVYTPDLTVVTNLELDHPEEFTDEEAVDAAFDAFLARRVPGSTAWLCLDDPGTRRLAERHDDVATYGTDPRADVQLVVGPADVHRVRRNGEDLASLELAVPGRHNLLNATAAIAVCLDLGVDVAAAARGLTRFTGAARRFQRLGTVGGVQVVDDYAHHPTELRATLAAARAGSPGRVVLVVQPHRYSRTQVLGAELGRAAAGADLVLVTDVYGSSEAAVPGVTGQLVADAASAAGANVSYVPYLTEVVDRLAEIVRDGDLVLVTGAGDVTQVGPALLARLDGGS
ncbi:UDP-N-acetylmuramate--L-alanine ligase [Nitriliruptor alkaliphilus]|uniref:UDP-N-acetylmuramate--L-alanine ligase n=1 Tax=Nitriliruptor alkaliphilus TaxID=427918 RepID=UPI00069706C7|nr:UDP-N-acetylmuramate--L-alanine ligase [Nitriliruptor alkaliphilus]